jgi:hypothetical protein
MPPLAVRVCSVLLPSTVSSDSSQLPRRSRPAQPCQEGRLRSASGVVIASSLPLFPVPLSEVAPITRAVFHSVQQLELPQHDGHHPSA